MEGKVKNGVKCKKKVVRVFGMAGATKVVKEGRGRVVEKSGGAKHPTKGRILRVVERW